MQFFGSKYDIEYHTQKAIKGSVLAEYLAHQPVDDYQSVTYDFLDGGCDVFEIQGL